MARQTAAEVVWRPQPRQALFMARPEDEALYGGAAGGGKSDALVMEALRLVHIPHYKGLILRKTFPQLGELIDKTRNYYPRIFPGAKYNGAEHCWRFPSGAKILFGSLQHTADRTRYQGQAYDFIAFDELTHFTWEEYSYLFSRNRPNGPGTRVYLRSTANPGGVGHGWVKERFVSAGPPMKTIWDEVSWREPDGTRRTGRKSRIFVPASVFDNQKLLQNDPQYAARLAALPAAERDALLYGSWDSFFGQVFTEWRNDPDHYEDRRWTHVVAPFRVPESWSLWRGFDWGYSRPFSVGWYAADGDGCLYRIRELYGCTGQPNVGLKWEAGRVAAEIRRIESEDPNLKGRTIRGVADPAIFADSAGTGSIAETMGRCGVWWDPGQHGRISGKLQVHHHLAFDEGGRPGLQVFSTCRHFIRTVPALVYSSHDVEDVDTAGEDHIYDELRYVCMENPKAPPVRAAKKEVLLPPALRDEEGEGYGTYAWYRSC